MKYQSVIKTILTVLLILTAGFFSLFIKDKIDSRNPEYALPIVSVSADGTSVPIETTDFEWRLFFNGTIKKEKANIYDISVDPAILLGGEVLQIDYSLEPVSVTIKRTDSYNYNFYEIDNLDVPTERGGYLYELDINYKRGSETCYFYIVVD